MLVEQLKKIISLNLDFIASVNLPWESFVTVHLFEYLKLMI